MGASSEDFFGYSQAVSAAGRYEGLKFGQPDVVVYLDGQSVLVQPDAARRQIEEDEKAQPTYVGQGETGTGQVGAGAEVEITLEIRADISEGVPDNVKRTVSENCRTLKFVDFKFERE